jgi:hypothetical protein
LGTVIFAQIDWHDFSVVEVIQFQDGDELTTLPAPMDLDQLLNKSLEEKARLASQGGAIDYISTPAWKETETAQMQFLQQTRTGSTKVVKTNCPNCGASMPVDELEEHMRSKLTQNGEGERANRMKSSYQVTSCSYLLITESSMDLLHWKYACRTRMNQ